MTDNASNHTPGPWRVFDVLTDIEIVADRRTATETESIVQFKGQRNAKANASLIAAAPELLAVAKLALDHLDGQEYLQVCAIIAKAEGAGS
jgi:hypothetical protein